MLIQLVRTPHMQFFLLKIYIYIRKFIILWEGNKKNPPELSQPLSFPSLPFIWCVFSRCLAVFQLENAAGMETEAPAYRGLAKSSPPPSQKPACPPGHTPRSHPHSNNSHIMVLILPECLFVIVFSSFTHRPLTSYLEVWDFPIIF